MSHLHRNVVIVIALALIALLGAGCSILGITEDFGGHAFDVCAAPSIGAKFGGGGHPPADKPGLDRERVSFVMAVDPGSPADRAGLKQWDIVTSVDGRDFATPIAIREAVAFKRPGDTVVLQVIREDRPIEVAIPIDAG